VTAGGGGRSPAAGHRLEASGETAPGFAGVAGGAGVGDASAAAVMAARRLRLRGFRHLTR
jgi:hypothetical protein